MATHIFKIIQKLLMQSSALIHECGPDTRSAARKIFVNTTTCYKLAGSISHQVPILHPSVMHLEWKLCQENQESNLWQMTHSPLWYLHNFHSNKASRRHYCRNALLAWQTCISTKTQGYIYQTRDVNGIKIHHLPWAEKSRQDQGKDKSRWKARAHLH